MCQYYKKIDFGIYKCITEPEYIQLQKDSKAKAEFIGIVFMILFFVWIICFFGIIIIHTIEEQIKKRKYKNNL